LETVPIAKTISVIYALEFSILPPSLNACPARRLAGSLATMSAMDAQRQRTLGLALLALLILLFVPLRRAWSGT